RLPFPLSPVLPFSAALLPPEEAAALGLLLAGLGGLRLDLRGSLLRGGLLRGLALGPLALEVLPALLDDGEPPAERVEDAAVEEPVAHHLEHPRLLDEVGLHGLHRRVLPCDLLELGLEVLVRHLDPLLLDQLLLHEEPADLRLGLLAARRAPALEVEPVGEFAALPLAHLVEHGVERGVDEGPGDVEGVGLDELLDHLRPQRLLRPPLPRRLELLADLGPELVRVVVLAARLLADELGVEGREDAVVERLDRHPVAIHVVLV